MPFSYFITEDSQFGPGKIHYSAKEPNGIHRAACNPGMTYPGSIVIVQTPLDVNCKACERLYKMGEASAHPLARP